MKMELSQSSTRLTEKITQMENFISNLEEIFITVEENFGRQEQNLEQHYSDVLQTLSQRNSENSTSLPVTPSECKQKLRGLCTRFQLLACGPNSCRDDSQSPERTCPRSQYGSGPLFCPIRIEDFAKEEVELKVGVSLDFATPPVDLSGVKQMMESINVVPAPSAPVMNPQVVNSATHGPRVWRSVAGVLFSGRLHLSVRSVKETHCVVKDLLPNAQYEFWVTATNTTGISPASERAVYMTVPSPPVIKLQECVSCLEAALIRWDSGNTNPVESYTLELSEADNSSSVTESIVAIPTCECVVQLQPWKRYIIHIRAVNIGGASERSQPITISTTGTQHSTVAQQLATHDPGFWSRLRLLIPAAGRDGMGRRRRGAADSTFFHLLKETAHPSLSVSADGFTMFYLDEDLPISEMVFSDSTFSSCVAVLGDLIPVRGRHYWEVEVDEWAEYRVGVAYEDTQRTSYLGANATSWCMRHILTPSRHKYEFLHNGWSADVRITVQPLRIGVFLDYERGTLSFYNAELRQHLHTFNCCFHHYVLPCFALDKPGALTLHTGLTAPGFITLT
ncbi:hypothetical protein NFI96_031990 [Prochilodus magdalenae]|nr:hypothetical protein NFI96_031990 [Prochilodus magdalenae]